jgi:hypothetical protein
VIAWILAKGAAAAPRHSRPLKKLWSECCSRDTLNNCIAIHSTDFYRQPLANHEENTMGRGQRPKCLFKGCSQPSSPIEVSDQLFLPTLATSHQNDPEQCCRGAVLSPQHHQRFRSPARGVCAYRPQGTPKSEPHNLCSPGSSILRTPNVPKGSQTPRESRLVLFNRPTNYQCCV